jgi:hypothetical protein
MNLLTYMGKVVLDRDVKHGPAPPGTTDVAWFVIRVGWKLRLY